jgi:hypothetical protein
MIRFYCEYCAHKIRVRDEDIGRQGKCPQCGKVIRIPTESTIIEFTCENCDKVISVPKSHAGKQAVCPKCHIQFIIPSPQFQGSVEKQEYSGDLIDRTTDSTHGLTLLDVPEEYKLKEEQVHQLSISEEDLETEENESDKQRSFPWIIDIFLYPISLSGLLHLGIFTVIPFVLYLIGILLGPFGMIIAVPSFLINIAISIYLYWYVTECIRDSAKGSLRAPEAFGTTGIEEMCSQALYILGCCLVFWGPVFFYGIFNNKSDIVYWFLFIYGIFFFPMGLLACVMFDSIRGLNPLLIIVSILSTIFQYSGLVLLIAGIELGFKSFKTMQTDPEQQGMTAMILLESVFFLILLYITFVVAHLLGRFFWRNQEKLNWEV